MKCLGADLTLAGVPRIDPAGRYVDFHSLRVSLSTMLAAHKVSPRAAQALMRHTDEKLLPLAAELVNVPAIPTVGAAPNQADALPANAVMQSLVADLSQSQKQSLLQMLSRSLAS